MLSMKSTFVAVLLLTTSSITIDAEDCNEDFTAASGSIINSGFPAPYANDLDCYYTITTPSLTSIVLEIMYLDLEDPVDYIQIYDGPTTDSPLLGEYTGNIINSSEIYTVANKALIYFHTDYSITYSGFYVYYYSVDIPEGSCPDEYYDGDSGEISSPNYPNAYTKKVDCVYRITTSSGTQIHLHFDYLDIFESTNCSEDYLAIYDGPSDSNRSLGIYCGPGPVSDIFGSSNEIYAVFHSKKQNDDHLGFHITYSTEACSGPILISGDYGSVTSPGYPLTNYPNSADCSYIVTTPMDSHVLVHIDYINLEYGGDNCPFDYVRVYNGGLDTDFILGTLCGTGPYKDMETSLNQVLIKFHSDLSNAFPGFSITYTSTYTQQLNATKSLAKKEDIHV